MRYELTDDEWTAIKPMLPNTQKIALAGAHDVNGPLTVFCFE